MCDGTQFGRGARRAWRVVGLAAVLAGPVHAAAPVVILPDTLPAPLSRGWEETDGDPRDGVAGLARATWRPADPVREPGPFGGVRWYRLRLDLSACRGLPLAFYAVALRDSDEAYLDDARIGASGAFPPARDPANLLPRSYALPSHLVDAPGVRTLTLRVYHGPRRSSVFREAPVIDRLAFTARRAWHDQTLVALASFGIGLTFVFGVLYRAGRDGMFLAFGGFTLFMSLYLLGSHSAWTRLGGRADLPFRFAALGAVLLFLCYCVAVARLVRVRLPRRFRVYATVLGAYALAALAVPDVGLLVWPTRVLRLLLFVGLLELAVPTLAAVRERRPGAPTALAAHGFFVLGLLLVDARAPQSYEFYAVVVVVLALLALGLHGLAVKQVEARVRAVLGERTRLARELHDTVAQDLVAVGWRLEVAAEALATEPDEAARQLEQARALVRGGLASARRSLLDLREPALDRAGLAGALRSIGRRLGGATPVDVSVRGGARALPDDVERHLFAIGREALLNAVRHADARRVRIELEYARGEVCLRVADDGRGFAGAADPERLGLRGIEERARAIGAQLVVSSELRKGTQVAVTVTGH